jgi:hypothetical protein
MASRKRVKRKSSKGRKSSKAKRARSSTACPVPSVKRRKANGPWIQRMGKLGGPGYTTKSDRERHFLLECSMDQFGYKSTLGSLLVLLRGKYIGKDVRQTVEEDIAWLKKHHE